MRALLGVATAALLLCAFKVGAEQDRLPAMSQSDMDRCEAGGGGSLIVTREAMALIIAEKERAALVACRNLL